MKKNIPESETRCFELGEGWETEYDLISIFLSTCPGLASYISYDLTYILVNEQMAGYFDKTIEDFCNQPLGWLNNGNNLREVMQEFINSDFESGNWEIECRNPKKFFLISARKYDEGIAIFGIDITESKQLQESLRISEERNLALIKAIPEVLQHSEIRRNSSGLEKLIAKLVNEPLFSGTGIKELSQSQIEKLVRLEVEIREAAIRLKEVEKNLYISDNALLPRIRELESDQRRNQKEWEDLESDLSGLRTFGKIITGTPGGIRSWILLISFLIISSTFLIDLGIKFYGVNLIKNNIEQYQQFPKENP
jgi:PAS domain-containing protein